MDVIYSNIIKTNKDLSEKIANKANANVIEGLTTVLQYFVAMIVNNKVKGADSLRQRSGRPLKSILCIFDNKSLPFKFHHLESSNTTFLDKEFEEKKVMFKNFKSYQSYFKKIGTIIYISKTISFSHCKLYSFCGI